MAERSTDERASGPRLCPAAGPAFAGPDIAATAGVKQGQGRRPAATVVRARIGDAARLFGLTARAIRFYEDMGLIQAGRDRLNVRYFDATARERLAWIATLRKAGIALSDIEEVLSAADSYQAVQSALSKTADRRAALYAQLARVDEVMEELASLARASSPACAAT